MKDFDADSLAEITPCHEIREFWNAVDRGEAWALRHLAAATERGGYVEDTEYGELSIDELAECDWDKLQAIDMHTEYKQCGRLFLFAGLACPYHR